MTRLAARAVLISTVVLSLAACEDGVNLGQSSGGASDAASTPATRQAGTRDVERPDIFNATEDALWDGRPSLGGIWVAHPDVTSPERAIVTNTSTNQRIAAALFRRERSNPGPRIQLSSDAAAALNILAGAPTEVTVVAVRPEEVKVEDPEPVISDEDVGEDGSNGAVVAAGAAGAASAGAASKPKEGNFFQRLFGGKNQSRSATPDGNEASQATAGTASAPRVETKTLDPVAAGAAAAIAQADASDKPAPRPGQEQAKKPAPAPAAAPAPEPLQNPYIQVGLYTVEANAFSARDNLRTAGIVPSVREGSNDNGDYWRILVGPVTTKDDQAKVLAQVKELGFADAFLTSE